MVEPSLTSALPVSKVCVLSCVRLGKGEGCSLDREGFRVGEGWGWEGRLGWALPSVGGSWGPWRGGVCVWGGVVFQAWAGSTGADGRGGGRWGAGPCPQPGRVTRAPPGLVAQPGWGMGTSTRVSAGARAGDEDIGVVGPVLGVRGMKVGTAPSSLFSRGRQRGTGAWFLAQSTQLAGGGAGFQPRPWFQNPQLFPPLYSGPLRTP